MRSNLKQINIIEMDVEEKGIIEKEFHEAVE